MTKPIILLIALLAAMPSEAQPKKDALNIDLQAAIQKESVQGDLKAAIAMYEKIVARAGDDRGIAAKALLRIGQCQEKLGSAEARKVYERVLRDFSDQSGAAEARARLAHLAGDSIVPRTIFSSPDIYGPRTNRNGQKVAAMCPEGVCLVDVASGASKAVVLKAEGARYWRPLPSPDGQMLAFTFFDLQLPGEKGDLRLQRVGQSAATTLIAGSLADRDYFSAVDWTADGKHILVARTNKNGTGLWLVPISGGAPRPLDAPGFDWFSGASRSKFSADGKWLAYPASKLELQGGGYVPSDVVVIPATGGKPQTVFESAGDERVVGWLSDGDLVATSNRNGKQLPYKLHIVDGKLQGEPQLLEDNLGEAEVVGVSITSGALFLASSITQTELYAWKPGQASMSKFALGYAATSPTFSPDGTSLAYVTGGIGGPSSVVIRDLLTGAERRLSGSTARISNLGWYPDSRHIFAICREGNWASRPTFRFDSVTGEMKPLPNVIGMSASSSPSILADGKTLVYTAVEKDGKEGFIRSLDTVTGKFHTLVRAQGPYTSIGSIGVSPDRKKIVYMQYNSHARGRGLAIIDVENPQPRVVYEPKSKDFHPYAPHFTPDQGNIIFWRSTGGAELPSELWQLPLATGEPTFLRKQPYTHDGPAFHPTTGEIILGVSKYTSELRIQAPRN